MLRRKDISHDLVKGNGGCFLNLGKAILKLFEIRQSGAKLPISPRMGVKANSSPRSDCLIHKNNKSTSCDLQASVTRLKVDVCNNYQGGKKKNGFYGSEARKKSVLSKNTAGFFT